VYSDSDTCQYVARIIKAHLEIGEIKFELITREIVQQRNINIKSVTGPVNQEKSMKCEGVTKGTTGRCISQR
jgi:hypothetical protein